MQDKIWLTIDGNEFWVEGGDFEEMLYAVRDRLTSKFKNRDRTWVVSNEPQDAAARLHPLRLVRSVDESGNIGELVVPASPGG